MKRMPRDDRSDPTTRRLRAIEERLRPYAVASSVSRADAKKRPSRISSRRLEALFDLQRREHEAARVLQQFWRHWLHIRLMRFAVRASFMAVRIQSVVRGFVTRRRVGVWYQQRSWVAAGWQAIIRRVLSNKHWRRRHMVEFAAARRVQALFRGYQSRHRLLLIRRSASALRIQSLWSVSALTCPLCL